MAVDHGLQGRENKKGRERRQKKAKQLKLVAKSLSSSASINSKKKQVLFDEESRYKFLSGFHKRKLERRKYGLAMQIIKDNKHLSRQRKETRAAVKHSRETENEAAGEEEIEKNSVVVENCDGDVRVFSDSQTSAMFGGEVSVSIDTGIAEQLLEHTMGTETNVSSSKRNNRNREPTEFEKAIKKAKQKIAAKKTQKHQKKSEGSRLMHKAMGAGVLAAAGAAKQRGRKKR